MIQYPVYVVDYRVRDTAGALVADCPSPAIAAAVAFDMNKANAPVRSGKYASPEGEATRLRVTPSGKLNTATGEVTE